jgi:hypothetical protein
MLVSFVLGNWNFGVTAIVRGGIGGKWRIQTKCLHKEEFRDLYTLSKRLLCAWHVARMEDTKNTYKIFLGET